MRGRIFWLKSTLLLGLVLSLNAAPTPTPTPTPKRSFFSAFKPRVNPSATPSRLGNAAKRGSHMGVDRSEQTPVPRPTPTAAPKLKSSPPGARNSPTPAPSKAEKSATPSGTPSPQKETSPVARSSSVGSGSVKPTPTPSPTATPTPSPSPTASASPTATVSPVSRPTKIELTFTKFEPPHGSFGDRDYRSARLSYRINVPNRMEFPTINFTVETSSGQLFERLFTLPAGSAFIDPGDNTEHTVALDPVPRDDWADAYAKADKATFNWSIEGQSSGHSEMPVKKSWP
jgi:hypothetical protein